MENSDTSSGCLVKTPASFAHLDLRPELLQNIASLNYESMTPIQCKTLPLMLNQEDVLAQAKTGSGKTVAFGLCLLNKLVVEFLSVQALVVCPTRELAEQVAQVLRQLTRLIPNVKILNLSGGMPLKPQMDSLKFGAHIVVGTPGRILKHLETNSLVLNQLKTVVLDEADRMLDMGFIESMQAILAKCPKKRQTLLFSATYTAGVIQLSKQFLQNHKEIFDEPEATNDSLQHLFYEVSHASDKFPLLKSLLLTHKLQSALIFCNTKQQTTDLTHLLIESGFSAACLNGDMEQINRDLVMLRFINKSLSILVATDVAARGLDIKELPVVINYDLAFEIDVHIHRIGRTGRAGHKGLALSIATPADAQRICSIEDQAQRAIVWENTTQLTTTGKNTVFPEMITLCLFAGKKDKIRPGDILGALTKDAGLNASVVGKIDVGAQHSYVAIHRNHIDRAYTHFDQGKLKGRKVRVKKIK